MTAQRGRFVALFAGRRAVVTRAIPDRGIASHPGAGGGF